MLKIRLQRTGRKNDPSFRVVVTEHTSSPKAGKNVAQVGSYHPKTKDTVLDAEAIKGWLAKGAQASGTLHNMLITKGIITGKKINVLGKKTPIIKEAPPAPEPAPAAVAEAPVAEAAPAEKPEEAPAA